MLAALSFRGRCASAAEILVLRRQLALHQERRIRPRRIDPVTRISLAILSRLFDWRGALVIVCPEKMIRWHRAGWKLFWRLKSRPGRPPIPQQLRVLIRRMATENTSWGEERIANELLLKLGIQVSPRTVRKYSPYRPPGRPRGDLRWSTFLRLQAQGIIACDFLVVVTASFRLLYVFVLIEHHSRRLVHYNVTARPSSAWTRQQLREAIGFEERYKFLLHDRDCIFAKHLDESVERLGIRVLKSPPRSPMANAICERVIGTIRPECLDWLIPLSESHLRSILKILDPPLQYRAPAHGAGSGCSRSAAHPSRLPNSQFTPSPRRIVRCPCHTHPWRTPSRILTCVLPCVTQFLRKTGDRSTPHFHFEAGHVREMLEIVCDHGHPLGNRV